MPEKYQNIQIENYIFEQIYKMLLEDPSKIKGNLVDEHMFSKDKNDKVEKYTFEKLNKVFPNSNREHPPLSSVGLQLTQTRLLFTVPLSRRFEKVFWVK
jgi:hypothetical protein